MICHILTTRLFSAWQTARESRWCLSARPLCACLIAPLCLDHAATARKSSSLRRCPILHVMIPLTRFFRDLEHLHASTNLAASWRRQAETERESRSARLFLRHLSCPAHVRHKWATREAVSLALDLCVLSRSKMRFRLIQKYWDHKDSIVKRI